VNKNRVPSVGGGTPLVGRHEEKGGEGYGGIRHRMVISVGGGVKRKTKRTPRLETLLSVEDSNGVKSSSRE